MKNGSIALFLTCGALLFAPAAGSAQVRIAGAITGTVTDSTSLVVPGAAVQLRDELTGVLKRATSNESGAFTFPDLNFGSYEVTVALQGFRTAAITHVVVESSRTTDLRITLEVRHVRPDSRTESTWRAGGLFRNLLPADHERVIRFIFAELRSRQHSH